MKIVILIQEVEPRQVQCVLAMAGPEKSTDFEFAMAKRLCDAIGKLIPIISLKDLEADFCAERVRKFAKKIPPGGAR